MTTKLDVVGGADNVKAVEPDAGGVDIPDKQRVFPVQLFKTHCNQKRKKEEKRKKKERRTKP